MSNTIETVSSPASKRVAFYENVCNETKITAFATFISSGLANVADKDRAISSIGCQGNRIIHSQRYVGLKAQVIVA